MVEARKARGIMGSAVLMGNHWLLTGSRTRSTYAGSFLSSSAKRPRDELLDRARIAYHRTYRRERKSGKGARRG